MGFPVGYTEVLLPKLLFNTLSILGLIRRLILTFLRLLGLSDFLEPDIVWPDLDPSSTTSTFSHHNHNHNHNHNHYFPYPPPSTYHPVPLPLPNTASVSASLIREMLPAVIKFAELSSESNGSEPPERCAVCLYDFEDDEEIRKLSNCRHMFHRLCLDRWMDCDRRTCPLCRTPFVPEELQDAFNQKLWAAAEIVEEDEEDVDGSGGVIAAVSVDEFGPDFYTGYLMQ